MTDPGRRRLRNEDAFICEPPLFAVADGMGGARAGEIAAGLAATALEEAGSDTQGTEGVAALRQVKKEFDPKGILSPGNIFPV